MCGIIGVVGRETETLSTVLNSLATLEYRGYDSAGVALSNGTLSVHKKEGKLEMLRGLLDDIVPSVDESPREVLSDESGRTSHQNSLHSTLHTMSREILCAALPLGRRQLHKR